MQRYQTHPDHQKALTLIRGMCEDIRAVDFVSTYHAPENLEEADPFRNLKTF